MNSTDNPERINDPQYMRISSEKDILKAMKRGEQTALKRLERIKINPRNPNLYLPKSL